MICFAFWFAWTVVANCTKVACQSRGKRNLRTQNRMRGRCLTTGPEVVSSSLTFTETDNEIVSTSIEIDNEIVSTAILPLPLTQEGQLSVTAESTCMCTEHWLTT